MERNSWIFLGHVCLQRIKFKKFVCSGCLVPILTSKHSASLHWRYPPVSYKLETATNICKWTNAISIPAISARSMPIARFNARKSIEILGEKFPTYAFYPSYT